MLHSTAIEPHEFHLSHQALLKKLLSYSRDQELEERIQYDPKEDAYYETNVYESFLHDTFIEPYDAHVFWTRLADELAKRDLLRELGEEKLFAMDSFERASLLSDKSAAYEDEFEEHGLEYFTLQKSHVIKNR
jgi:hypothetical protein